MLFLPVIHEPPLKILSDENQILTELQQVSFGLQVQESANYAVIWNLTGTEHSICQTWYWLWANLSAKQLTVLTNKMTNP